MVVVMVEIVRLLLVETVIVMVVVAVLAGWGVAGGLKVVTEPQLRPGDRARHCVALQLSCFFFEEQKSNSQQAETLSSCSPSASLKK